MASSLRVERPPHVPADRVVDFDVYHPPGVEAGLHEAWEKLHAAGVRDLMWTPHNGGHWIATRGALIERVLSDYEHFSTRARQVPKLVSNGGRDARKMIPASIDPPEHRPYRMLLNSTFSPRAIAAMEPVIRNIARALVEKVCGNGRCEFVSDYADILPIQVFMSIVDLPLADSARLKSWVQRITRPDYSKTLEDTRASIEDAQGAIHAYLEPHIEARIGGGAQDLLSRMINGKVDDRALNKSEMMDLCTMVLFGGLDTVVNFLSFVFLYLARNPVHRRALAADHALIPNAIDEFLRRFPLAMVGREVCETMDLDGVQIAKGDMIMAPTMLAGTDDRWNKCPLDVDFNRSVVEHTSFGAGAHRCPGAQLAATEIRISLEEWLSQISEFEVAPGAEIKFYGGTVAGIGALPLVWGPGATPAPS